MTTPRVEPASPGLLKRIASSIAVLMILPLVGLYRLGLIFLPDRREELFQGHSQLLSLWPGFMGNFLRAAFYRMTLARCSRNCYIGFGTLFVTPDVEIGEHVYIGAHCMIANAVIHDDVLIGSNVDVLGGKRQHYFDRLDVPIRLQGGEVRTVSIGPDAWIGNGAVVTDDVGAQAIVAAGAVVVKAVAPRSVVGGNPARVLADRTLGG